jgi:hypothetical protein
VDFLTAPLTHKEFESLREVSKGMMRRVIPKSHADKLIGLKLLREGLGGLVLTPKGKLRLGSDK